MKVFISWSGKKSRDVARAFGDWLPLVLHAIEPFVSAKDIQAGTRWQAEIAKELDDTDFGLICVTKENQSAEWLNFEAGALAKSVTSSRVVPLAIDLSPADISNPLGQFQAMKLTRNDIGEILTSMNEACPSPIKEANLRKAVEKWWPDLQDDLTKINNRAYGTEATSSSPTRSDRELLEEVLDSVRGFGRAPAASVQSSEGDQERAEKAIHEFDNFIMSGKTGITAWSTDAHGSVVEVEMSDEPSSEIHRVAELIGSIYDVRFRLGKFGTLEKSSEKTD